MPKKSRKAKKNNLKIGIIFSILILLLILLSLFGKIVSVIQQGKYDSNYPFSLRVVSGRDAAFLSVFPREEKIVILKVEGAQALEESLPLPWEGEISASSLPDSNVSSFFRSHLQNTETNLTIIDMARLYLLTKSVDSEDIIITDKLTASLFLDEALAAEDKRIEVVNATGVYGVGNRVAKLITNLGGNVVFVSTADKDEKESVIYFEGEKGYTVKRLGRVLGYKTLEQRGKSISDITVRIGQDSIESISK